MESAIKTPSDQVRTVITNPAKEFELYMGHKVRAKTQDRRIKKLFEWVHDEPPNERIIAFIDYKMNFEPERLRDTQLQYYGKSGMSWHGSAVLYRPGKRTVIQYLERKRKKERNRRWK